MRHQETRLISEIGVVAYPDCQVSAIHGLTDIFRKATEYASANGDDPAAIRVSSWTVTPELTVVCTSDTHPGNPHQLSHIILPPSLAVPELMTSVATLRHWLLDLKASGTILCAVCAGVFVLAETGMLDGRTATTHWAFAAELAERFPAIDVDASRMVIDGIDIMTAAGILAWVDLGLTLVERLLGPSVMLLTSQFILADPPRRQQATYRQFMPRLGHGDSAILAVQHHIHANVRSRLNLQELARIADLHPRTFQRRFEEATGLTPTTYLQSVRVSRAREALELTTSSVEQISFDVGYIDVSTFRRLFQRITGVTPSQYRARFGIAGAAQNRSGRFDEQSPVGL